MNTKIYYHNFICYYIILTTVPFRSCNLEQNICRLFHVLAQFLLTASETELDYYHQEMNIRVASRVTERFKT